MTITELSETLAHIAALLEQGEYDTARRALQAARASLVDDRLLTTREAADLLGIRSVNTVKTMARVGDMRYEKVGTHMRIPLSEVKRIQDSQIVRQMRRLEDLHELTRELDVGDPVPDEILDDLSAPPGSLPWQR